MMTRRLPDEWPATTVSRFWQQVERLDLTSCWPWKGGRSHGYGHFLLERGSTRVVKAHRVAWTLERGAIPPGLLVLHRCDNPRCVNLEHLWLGTHADNTADMLAKGRGRKSRKAVGLSIARLKRASA